MLIGQLFICWLDWLDTYLIDLLCISQNDPVATVTEWVAPFSKLKVTCTRIPSLLDYIKTNIESLVIIICSTTGTTEFYPLFSMNYRPSVHHNSPTPFTERGESLPCHNNGTPSIGAPCCLRDWAPSCPTDDWTWCYGYNYWTVRDNG